MLRTRSPIRPLGRSDREDALALCARDLPANVFVAARILQGALDSRFGTLLGLRRDAELEAMCWVSANVVPVRTDPGSSAAFADRIRRQRSRCASILGPVDQVAPLWSSLETTWSPARAIRANQPLMATRTPPSAHGMPLDDRVRPAHPNEVDLVLPASAHMFTNEIGYAPYAGSARTYRTAIADLVENGHTYVIVERRRVIFKADIGSVALGCAQVQGVWLSPELRGQGLASPMMAAVVEQIMMDDVDVVTLYVNDFNAPARAVYERIGMSDIGTFSTILL